MAPKQLSAVQKKAKALKAASKRRKTSRNKSLAKRAKLASPEGGGVRQHACAATKKKACVSDKGCSWRKKSKRAAAHCSGKKWVGMGCKHH